MLVLKLLNLIRDDKGLTLIELIAAIVLLSVALIPLADITNIELESSREAGERYVAMQLANEKAEEILHDLRVESNGNQPVPSYAPSTDTDYPMARFTREIETDIINSGSKNLAKYTVTVSWDSGSVEVYLLGTEVDY